MTGTVTITDSQVTGATLLVNLTSLQVGEKTQPEIATSLDTRDHPNATITLT